ncbi:AgrD family cyclic lactone autoinducer peptide [Paenibacillus sp. NRS-1782]
MKKQELFFKAASFFSFAAILSVATASVAFIHSPEPPEELLK